MLCNKIIRAFLSICLAIVVCIGMVACASNVQIVDFQLVSQSEYIRDGKKCILYRVYADREELTEEELAASFNAFVKKQNDSYYLHDVMLYSSKDMAEGGNAFDVAEMEEMSEGSAPVVRFPNVASKSDAAQSKPAEVQATEIEQNSTEIDGYGAYRCDDGSVALGKLDSNLTGMCMHIANEGITVVGNFEKGKPKGYCAIYLSGNYDGYVFWGNFVDGNAIGTIFMPSGETTDGEYKDGQLSFNPYKVNPSNSAAE